MIAGWRHWLDLDPHAFFKAGTLMTEGVAWQPSTIELTFVCICWQREDCLFQDLLRPIRDDKH
jgi:hypothetical protein